MVEVRAKERAGADRGVWCGACGQMSAWWVAGDGPRAHSVACEITHVFPVSTVLPDWVDAVPLPKDSLQAEVISAAQRKATARGLQQLLQVDVDVAREKRQREQADDAELLEERARATNRCFIVSSTTRCSTALA